MRELLIGDLHFGVKNNSIAWLNLQTKFFEEQIFKILDEENLDRIVFLGDLTDIRYSINLQFYYILYHIHYGFNCHSPYSSTISVFILSIGFHTTPIEKYGLKSYLYGISSVISFGSLQEIPPSEETVLKSW